MLQALEPALILYLFLRSNNYPTAWMLLANSYVTVITSSDLASGDRHEVMSVDPAHLIEKDLNVTNHLLWRFRYLCAHMNPEIWY